VTDIAKLNDLVLGGHQVIDLQFNLASQEPSLKDLWVLGYCFGVFDAFGQIAKLDQYTDGIVLITIGFSRITSDELKAADSVRHAINNQADPVFANGHRTGGADVYAFLSDANTAPMALCRYLGC